MKLNIGNDNGNSEHDIIINGHIIKQINVFSKISKLPNLEELNPDFVASNIHSNLIVTIKSASLNNSTPTTYYVGNYATRTGKMIRNIEVGAINSKLESDIPFVNTLAQIAGYAVKDKFLKDNSIKTIDVDCNMTTALPITQYSKENSRIFANRFMNNGNSHIVTVYLGENEIEVKVTFNYVKVIPEAVPTVFYLKSCKLNKKAKILEEYLNDYNITTKEVEKIDFDNKRILHISIGEGTTEYPLTEDINFSPHFITGSNNGVGHAINQVLSDFIQEKSLAKLSRQDFSNLIRDNLHKYHDDALELIQEPLEEQALAILDITKQMISKANNNIDYIFVYGGGSILMKPYFKEPLKKFANRTDIKVVYIPEPFATEIEAWGLYEFTLSDLFKSLKEKYISQQEVATTK